MPLGAVARFVKRDISRSGIAGMVRAISEAVRISLTGRDYAFADALSKRIMAGCTPRDEACEVQAVFDFVRDGGALRGEVLTPGPRFVFEVGVAPSEGEFIVDRVGGIAEVYDARSGRHKRTVPPAGRVVMQLPERAWEGLAYRLETKRLDSYPTLARAVETQADDCDGHTVVHATLLKIRGYDVGAKIVAPDGRHAQHVYAVVGLPRKAPQKYLALDTTDPRSTGPGWDPSVAIGMPDGRPMPSVMYKL